MSHREHEARDLEWLAKELGLKIERDVNTMYLISKTGVKLFELIRQPRPNDRCHWKTKPVLDLVSLLQRKPRAA